jgi:hypothetical protein
MHDIECNLFPIFELPISFCSSSHFVYGDFYSKTTSDFFKGDFSCVGLQTTIKGIQYFTTLFKIINNACSSITDDTIAVDVAFRTLRMRNHLPEVPTYGETNISIVLDELDFCPFQRTMEDYPSFNIAIGHWNNIGLVMIRHSEITYTFLNEQLLHFFP